MDFKFKLFLRIMAAFIFALVFGHQTWLISDVFGLSLNTASFLLGLLLWYIFVYRYLFYGYTTFLPVGQENHYGVLLIVLTINIILVFYIQFLHSGDSFLINIEETGCKNFFSIFPELVVFTVVKFSGFTEKAIDKK